jgi:hypothetical protein
MNQKPCSAIAPASAQTGSLLSVSKKLQQRCELLTAPSHYQGQGHLYNINDKLSEALGNRVKMLSSTYHQLVQLLKTLLDHQEIQSRRWTPGPPLKTCSSYNKTCRFPAGSMSHAHFGPTTAGAIRSISRLRQWNNRVATQITRPGMQI